MSEERDFLLTVPETQPEEAAKNIENANFFDVGPDNYVEIKPNMSTNVDDLMRVPANFEPATKEYLSQSGQQRALAKDDYHQLNFFEKRLKYYKEQIIDIPERNREINDLYNKKIDGELSQKEQDYLDLLESDYDEMTQRQYGIEGDFEKFGVEVLSATGDLLRTYEENKGIIAATTGGGAVVGGLGSLGIPVPGARVVGVTAGATKGFVAGMTIAGFVDGYQQMKAGTYRELSKATDNEGNPLDIDHQSKAQISYAVGILGGVAAGATGAVLAKGNPFLQRFVSSKTAAATLSKSPALLAKMKILGHVTKNFLAEGTEESFQELIQIMGVEFGKAGETEAGFENAIDNILSKETFQRLKKSALVGGATGGLVAGVSSLPGYKGLKKRIGDAQNIAKKRMSTLEKQNQILENSAMLNSTKMKELAPEEMSKFKKTVYSKIGIDDEVWFTLQDLQEFTAGDPEKTDVLREIIDPSGELNRMSKELNTPVKLSESDVMDIAEKFPEFTDYLRLEPEAQSPKEIRTEAQEHLANLEAAEAKREEILSNLGVDQDISPEDQAEIDAILNIQEDGPQIESEIDYLEDVYFEPIEGIVSPEDVMNLNLKEIDVRIDLAKALKGEVDKRFDIQEQKIVRDTVAKKLEAQKEALADNYNLIELFTKNVDDKVAKGHKKKGYSPLAIDPKFLPEDMKEIYLNNPVLKKRKAFVDGGLYLEEAAAMAGVEDGETLLKILAETPTPADIKETKKQLQMMEKNRIANIAKPARDKAIDKAFTNQTKLRLRQMKEMRNKEWTTLKRGIIKIGGKLPTVKSLNDKAKLLLSKTKLSDINPRRFELGEKKSRRKAMDHWLKTEFEDSYKNLEAAALNNELRREAIKIQDKVNRYKKFWKDVKKPGMQMTLKEAGMLKAMEEFTDVFKLSGNPRSYNEMQKFNAFIEKQSQEGNYTPTVPPRLSDTTLSAKDMTTEQFLAISEMGEFIVHQAKLKNKLRKIQADRADLVTAERIAEEVQTKLVDHPAYDLKKAEEAPKNMSFSEKLSNKFDSYMSLFSSLKTSAFKLDQFKPGGYFHDLLVKRLKDSYTAKRQEILDIRNRSEEIINQYGMKEFKEMFNDFKYIPEFDGINQLSDGDGKGFMRKIDLIMLQAYMGDPEGRRSMSNFKKKDGTNLTPEIIQTILDRELTKKDAAFTQAFIHDQFKRFKKRAAELHKRTTGIEPRMVEGVGFTHQGVEYPGGYVPIERMRMSDDAKASNFLEKMMDKHRKSAENPGNENSFFAKLRAAEMTDQDRLKNRTGSERELDINFENTFNFFEEIVHDLHFREAGIDTLKVLKNPINVKNMKAVLGNKEYVAMLNHVKDAISKTSGEDPALFSDDYRVFNKIIDKMHHLHAIKSIGAKVSSGLIQFDALKNISQRLGPKANLYLASTAKRFADNPVLFHEYAKIAEDINPDIKFEKDSIDDALVKESWDFLPATQPFFKKYASDSAKSISSIIEMKNKAVDSTFYLVREVDRTNKILATLAISEQFLAGDVEGYSIEKVQGMTEAERAKKLRSIVQQTIDLSLTASSPIDKTFLEKHRITRLFTRYWTDRRSNLNTAFAQATKSKYALKKGEVGQASRYMMHTALMLGVSSAYVFALRKGLEGVEDFMDEQEDTQDLAMTLFKNLVTAPIDEVLESTPIVADIYYSATLQKRSDYRSVSTPLYGVFSDFATGAATLKELLATAVEDGEFPDPRDLRPAQRKALLDNMGYILGGAPTGAINKMVNMIEDGEFDDSLKGLNKSVGSLNKQIDKFIDVYKDTPEAQKFIEDLKEYRDNVLPQFILDAGETIPSKSKEIIKFAMSKGEWNYYDKDTGAAGSFGFTEERWNQIMQLEPSLGLTENGRVSKNQEQQEKAMEWSMEDHAQALIFSEIPVNEKTLYGAHRFGIDTYIEVYNADNSKKLTDIIRDAENDPLLKGFSTVKSIKSHISRKVKEADIDSDSQ